MFTRELIDAIPDRADLEVLITVESGPYRTPGKVSDLVGVEPVDTIIEADFPRSHVDCMTLKLMLLKQDPEGTAQVYAKAEGSHEGYYNINKVTVNRKHEPPLVVIVADSFRTGT